MELQFKEEGISCLEPALQEVQNIEQTQELRLSDDLPDVGRIISAWGQVILRGKEWMTDAVALSGGVMVWVLYLPEDGSEPRTIDSWIPFQLRWDLPDHTPEGQIRTECLTRFVDARSVSARKIMVRCGVAALMEAYAPITKTVYLPAEIPEDVQLRTETYPVRLPKEAGEKEFQLEEVLTLSARPVKQICSRMIPVVTDQRVMGDKVVFRGNGMLHIAYLSEDGKVHSQDLEVPFSQFAELNQVHSPEAETDVLLNTTNLELELDAEGSLRLKCALVGQYLICDVQMLKLVTDAYSTVRPLKTLEAELELPYLLDQRMESAAGEQTIPADAEWVADVQFLPDFPRQRRMDDRIRLEVPGLFQLLYYDREGLLQSANARWEAAVDIRAHPETQLKAVPAGAPFPKAMPGSGTIAARADSQLRLTTTSGQGIPMVTGLELGEAQEPDESRPSLILRRAGEGGLWDVAKNTRSTMDAIRRANSMEGDPAPGQMLLIPIP